MLLLSALSYQVPPMQIGKTVQQQVRADGVPALALAPDAVAPGQINNQPTLVWR